MAGALLASGVGLKVQTSRIATAKAETVKVQAQYDLFVEKARVLGEQQAEEAKRRDEANKVLMEQADEENKRQHAADIATILRLRRAAANPSSGTLPSAPTGSSRPDLICFDRAEYQREDGNALGILFAGARALADEGTAATIDLNSAKKWAKGLKLIMELPHALN